MVNDGHPDERVVSFMKKSSIHSKELYFTFYPQEDLASMPSANLTKVDFIKAQRGRYYFGPK